MRWLSTATSEQVVATPSPKDLNQLRKAKNDYDVLFSKATSLKQVLKTLLDVDEDLALMQLTELHQRGENALENLLSVNVEDIELLLEAYLEVMIAALRHPRRLKIMSVWICRSHTASADVLRFWIEKLTTPKKWWRFNWIQLEIGS